MSIVIVNALMYYYFISEWRDKEQHVLLFSGQVTVMTLKIKTIFVHTNCFFLKCLISTPKLNRITIGPLCKY
jgi:hypothetical protein